ncbi:MAG: insulinase family protein [Spirochaetaceae bacterium]|nr:insulinase family protein [Spirochaetaceae bacterium]
MKTRLLRLHRWRRTAVTIAAVAALATLLPAAWAQNPQDEIPFDPEVRRGTLGNGLTYYIKVNPEPPERIQLRLGVNAGSVLEQESERGLAHYLEHMAFNGTASFAGNEIIEYLESIGSAFGPDINGYTSFDETVYILELPTDPEVIAQGFDILSEWAYAITLDPDEVERERGVVLEEWRLGRGADQRIRDQQFPVLFGDSQYSVRLPIGLLEVIETASADDLRAFYERWYRPDLMAVVAVGDLDLDEMEALIREHFAAPPEGAADFPRAYPPDPPTDRTQFPVPPHPDLRVNVSTDPEVNLTTLWLYHKVPAQVGHDRAAYRRLLVDRLFGGMINARLYERSREADPPFLAAGSGRSLLVGDAATLYMAAYVDKDRIARGLDTLLEEMQRTAQHGFTSTELEREKATMLRAIESAWHEKDQRPSQRLAEEYLRHFLDGEPVPGVDAEYVLYNEMLPEITVEEVNRIAEPWRGIHNAVVLLSGPEGIPAGPETEAELIAKVTAAPSLEVAAYADETSDEPLLAEIPEPGAIVAEEAIGAVDAVRWTLSNGVTVIAKQTDFRDDEVLLSATSPGGTSLVEDADYVAAVTADNLVSGSGVGAHDVVALEKLLAGNTASLSPYIGGLFEGFTGDSSPDDLETLFQLVTLYATAPRMDADYFESYSSNLKSQAENRLSQPDAVFSDTYRSAISQDHFRTRPFTVEWVEELNLERSTAIYHDRFADLGDFTFIVVGAFEWDTLRSLTATYLATLPAAGRVETWRDVGIDPPPAIEERIVRQGIDERSITRVAFAGDMDWSREASLELSALGEMLQIRLRERVREELGGTYSIGIGASASALPDPEYQVTVWFSSDPERADELFEEVLIGVDWALDGAEQSYLDKAKEILRSSREEQLRRNGFWLGQIRGAVQRGEPFQAIAGFDERLDALTLEQVAEAARRYLSRDRYVRVVLLPEESESGSE